MRVDAKTKAKRLRTWVRALQSGEFKQAQDQLRDGRRNKFCCLGVACELYRRETGDGKWRRDGSFVVADDYHTDRLPPIVASWFGLRQKDPRLTRTEHASSLNDSGKSFEEIAALIRKRFKL